MSKYVIKGSLAAGIVVIFIILIIILIKPLFKQPPYKSPSGPHKVGTFHMELQDSKRLQGGEARRLSVRFFYPTNQETEKLPAMEKEVSEAFSKLYHIPITGGTSDTSFSNIDSLPLNKGPYPVVLFSHGGFSYDTQNLSTMEELASRGYIAVAISHTGESILTRFPDGTSQPMADSSYMNESMSLGKEKAVAYRDSIEQLKSDISPSKKRELYKKLGETMYKPLEPYLDTRINDIHFLLENLNQLQEEKAFPLSGLMDLEKIGMFGHSFGGITATYICSEENTPVKAGINMDAPVITYNSEDMQLKRPFAFFYSTQTAVPKSGPMDLSGCNNYYARSSLEAVYSLSVKGTAHYNYSDFNFMPAVVRLTPMLGSIEGERMIEIMNHSVADFFDLTLKKESGTLYFQTNLPYPELTLKKGEY